MIARGADALLDAMREGRATAVELTEAALAAARACQAELNAFSNLTCEPPMNAAAAVDRRRHAGEHRTLDGLPIVVKDLIDTAGIETRYGSPAFAGHVPTNDAEIVRRLTDAGAVMIGKATTHEFAWGVTTISETHGPTLNPRDRTRIAGGSSGGTAAIVAFGAVPAGIGTDTGGSVRIPAALCGVTGFKPSRGTWPPGGIFPLAPTLDHVGVIGRKVADCVTLSNALGLQAARPDEGRQRRAIAIAAPGGLRPEPDVARRFVAARRRLAALIDIVDVDEGPIPADCYGVFATIVLVEAARVHFERSDAARRGRYGAGVRQSLALARGRTMGDYEAAQDRRRDIGAMVDRSLETADFLLTPTTSIVAPAIGAETVTVNGHALAVREALMTYTSPFNMTGNPAVTVPLPGADGELPAGLQIVGRRGDDARLLSFAAQIEAYL